MRLPAPVFAFSITLLATPALAHELWLEPSAYTIDRAGSIQAEIWNGEGFGGVVEGEEQGASRIAFFPQRIAAARYFVGDASAPVDNRIGSTPAIDLDPLANGLHIVAYLSTPSTLDYDTWEKFQRFVDHKDLGADILAQHEARGLPLEGFVEVYTRCSKTLVGVGDAAGEDRRVGMETELVALDNPYTDDLTDGLRVQLFYQNSFRANEQVEVFEKGSDGEVVITLLRTDEDGIATLPVRPGFSYMVDAVVLREPSEAVVEATDAAWETLWANLTFAVPEN